MTFPLHTRGPWTFSCIGTADGDKEFTVSIEDGDMLADLTGCPNEEANARLMAASPDLFDVAAELSEWEANPDAYAGDLANLAHKARLAIAKATGANDPQPAQNAASPASDLRTA